MSGLIPSGKPQVETVLLSKRAAALPANIPSSHGDVIAFDSGHGFPPLFPDLTAEASAALTVYRHETLNTATVPDWASSANGSQSSSNASR